jgi:hypothetical protein
LKEVSAVEIVGEVLASGVGLDCIDAFYLGVD